MVYQKIKFKEITIYQIIILSMSKNIKNDNSINNRNHNSIHTPTIILTEVLEIMPYVQLGCLTCYIIT